ncbi:SAF domain-containing protein [Bacillus tianshenii]|nr:SAF domain-containing protein [Bacillus tianshenii]
MLESKRRAIILLIISFLLAAVAGFLILQKMKELNTQLGAKVEVYVAAGDIASRTLIQPDQIKTIEMPQKYANESFVTSESALKGKVTVVPLSEGDLITKNIIKPATVLRDENHRLVTMLASEKIRFDQELEALDRVDIIISNVVNDKPVTKVFMKDVLVAMVAKNNDSFSGVALEIPFEEASKLIHQQHYAQMIRVLKSNVGKGELNISNPFERSNETKPKPPLPNQNTNSVNTEQKPTNPETKKNTENVKKETTQ